MRRTETVPVPARETEKLVEVRCDLCGSAQKFPGDRRWDDRSEGNVEQVTVEFERGSSYPEGSSLTYQSFDVCPTCWRDKVVPWFFSQGAVPRDREADW